tara:strand:- start:840 stop:1034 length:195 start_codon:yes stop_codon:yes gene_type:complete
MGVIMTKLEKYSKAYYCASSNAEALRVFAETFGSKNPALLHVVEDVCRSIDLMDKYITENRNGY